MQLGKSKGFTLIELIAVLFIIGIVSAVVASRYIDTSAEEVKTADAIKAHLRYAQMRAMNSNSVWGVRFSGGSYFLFRNANTADRVSFPGEENLTVSLPAGISITQDVSFDSWGRPYNSTTGNTSGAESTAAVSFAAGGKTISITQETGFIP